MHSVCIAPSVRVTHSLRSWQFFRPERVRERRSREWIGAKVIIFSLPQSLSTLGFAAPSLTRSHGQKKPPATQDRLSTTPTRFKTCLDITKCFLSLVMWLCGTAYLFLRFLQYPVGPVIREGFPYLRSFGTLQPVNSF